jgi:hypothetical protein
MQRGMHPGKVRAKARHPEDPKCKGAEASEGGGDTADSLPVGQKSESALWPDIEHLLGRRKQSNR